MKATERRIAVGDSEVSALWLRPRGAVAVLALAHGAGAGMRHPFMENLADALAGEGIATLRYQFLYMEAGRRYPDRPPKAIAAVKGAVAHARRLARGLPLIAGGKSFGARMTSQAAAGEELPEVGGLIFFGFPLHAPGKPVCHSLGRRATLRVIEAADHGFAVPKRSGRTPEDVMAELATATRAWLDRHVLAQTPR